MAPGAPPPTVRPVPELLEVESYRRQAEAVVGRRIAAVDAPDEWYVKSGPPDELAAGLVGRRIVRARRIGKLLVLDLDDGGRLGLRFGMTGRLLVDGGAAIDRLEYSSGRNEPRWDRFRLAFDDGGDLRIRDPRRLGGVSLEPDESRLGVDALSLDAPALAAALGASTAPLKARLLDQARVAGIGNLLADEILYRAGLDPARPARRPERRRGRGAGPHHRVDHPGTHDARWQPHRRRAGGGRDRQPLPARRNGAGQAAGRRADDDQLPGPPAMSRPYRCRVGHPRYRTVTAR